MKKILWISNLIFPEIAKKLGIPINPAGGWMLRSSELLSQESDINLTVAAPFSGINEIMHISCDRKEFYLFPKENYISSYHFLKKTINPDVIHVFGTELPHAWSVLEVFDRNRVVFSLQGIVSEYSKYYFSELPFDIINRQGIYEIVTRSSIKKDAKSFSLRGIEEKKLLGNARNVIGRTNWDKAVAKSINNDLNYYLCNETLRESFYGPEWDINNVEPYSIFVSQGGYPIKGIHFAIEALSLIVRSYPEAKLYVSGTDLLKNIKNHKKYLASSYSRYISELITKHNLWNHVCFIGNLSESEMVSRFLLSNVYLCCSSIENSPNSLGEAMILGVPSVASYVGGIPSLLNDGEEGILYQYNSASMMADSIISLFSDKDLCMKLSTNSRKRAMNTHDPIRNNQTLIRIYDNMINKRDGIS